MATTTVAAGSGRRQRRGVDRTMGYLRGEGVDSALWLVRQANAAHLRRQRLVERIHGVMGPRGFLEILQELVRDGLLESDELDRRLTRYAQLDRQMVKAVGADRMPSRPVHIIGAAQ